MSCLHCCALPQGRKEKFYFAKLCLFELLRCSNSLSSKRYVFIDFILKIKVADIISAGTIR